MATKKVIAASVEAKMRPCGDRVLLEEQQADSKTSGGLLLPPGTARNENIAKFTILAIGSDVKGFAVDDTVLVSRFATQSFKELDVELHIVKAEEILAVLS